MRIIILGAPGAGKGTQAQLLCQKFDIPQISTGAIFRANVVAGSELGKLAKGYIDEGLFVPDEITDSLVRERLHQEDTQDGFLLDGYPRTLAQVASLDEILREQGHVVDIVLELVTDKDELVQRLLKRAQVEGRADDTAEVITRRMDVYAEQTKPLSRIYDQRGILARVDGTGTIEEVQQRLQDALRDR
ncbi:adenylate kinase [Flaviflexus huanghaiensis]|uniref:adenylate kinase n=1 Tax=Flaviflexus huanghaiensis TaxID=1111473 RepID=UPI0015F97266|nr:adenylate kinase [Flaviflexus huanghaiensis]